MSPFGKDYIPHILSPLNAAEKIKGGLQELWMQAVRDKKAFFQLCSMLSSCFLLVFTLNKSFSHIQKGLPQGGPFLLIELKRQRTPRHAKSSFKARFGLFLYGKKLCRRPEIPPRFSRCRVLQVICNK